MAIHLRPADYRRMRWKNGGGWTSEVAVGPGDGEEFLWRISIAEIETDGGFSRFPGVDRGILVLDGAGMILDVAGEAVELRADGPALAFPGEAAVYCRLSGGPTRDFNVMTRRGRYAHTLQRHTLAGAIDLGGPCLVYVHSGAAALADAALAAGDSVLIETADELVTLHGAAALVIAQLRAC